MTGRWRRGAAALAALALPLCPAGAGSVPYTSLTRAFADFAARTGQLPNARRVALFRRDVSPLFPAFYAVRTATPAALDQRIANGLDGFPAIADRYARVEASFPAALDAAVGRYRRYFPSFRLDRPIYLLHSLGELDGGSRTLAGRRYLIFGADVIARVHDPRALGPFLDHELFHIYNARAFAYCGAMWCGLWQEGLATYAAGRLNPGADDAALLLTVPEPLRPAVDARWREALCLTRARFDATDDASRAALFVGTRRAGQTLPPRFGYYIGYRLMKRLGADRTLAELAAIGHAPARRLLEDALADEIAAVGGCDSATAQAGGQQDARAQL